MVVRSNKGVHLTGTKYERNSNLPAGSLLVLPHTIIEMSEFLPQTDSRILDDIERDIDVVASRPESILRASNRTPDVVHSTFAFCIERDQIVEDFLGECPVVRAWLHWP